MAHRALLVPLFVLASLSASAALSAQVTPIAGPFEVSPRSYGFDDPSDFVRYSTLPPSLAALADGRFMVAWDQSLWVQGVEGSQYFFDLYTREIGAEGRPGPLELAFRGNHDYFPGIPAIAGDGLGGFTLAWDLLPSYDSEIHFQTISSGRFDDGPVSEGSHGGVESPAVAVHSTSTWAAAWERWFDSDGDELSDGEPRYIGLRTFHVFGEPFSPTIEIKPADPNVILTGSRVAVMADRFMVIWEASGGPRPPVLQGRLFALDGTPLSPVFQAGRLLGTTWEVLTDEVGGFWVVWQSPSTTGPLIRISHYSADGLRLGSARLGASSGPWRIHMNRRGEMAFVWTEPDGRVLLQVLDRFLVPRGKRQRVLRTVDGRWEGDVAIGDTGRVLVVWKGLHDVTTPNGDTLQPLIGKLWQVEE